MWYHFNMSTSTNKKLTAAQKILAEKYIALKAEESKIQKEIAALRPDIQAALETHDNVLDLGNGRRIEFSITTKIEYDAAKFSKAFPNIWSMVAVVDSAKVRQCKELGMVTDAQLAKTISESKTEKRILIKKG